MKTEEHQLQQNELVIETRKEGKAIPVFSSFSPVVMHTVESKECGNAQKVRLT